jgi:hypothetical protein
MPKGHKFNSLSFEEKIKMGLIKTPKEKLDSHFNYYYLFEKLGQGNNLGFQDKNPNRR